MLFCQCFILMIAFKTHGLSTTQDYLRLNILSFFQCLQTLSTHLVHMYDCGWISLHIDPLTARFLLQPFSVGSSILYIKPRDIHVRVRERAHLVSY